MGSLIKVHKLCTSIYLVICKSKLYELFSHNARCKHVHQAMCYRACKCVSSTRWIFLGWKYFRTLWERGSRTCKSIKCFAYDRTTYNVSLVFKFLWDECKSGPRIVLERVNPSHLSIVRAKARWREFVQ
jgi:hypothetical protein